MSTTSVVLNTLGLLALISIASCEIFNCNVQRNFSLAITSNVTVDFYDTKLLVKLDYANVRLYALSEEKGVSIRARDVIINFTGMYGIKFPFDDNPPIPIRIMEKFREEITGNAKRSPINNTAYSVYDYRLILLPFGEETMRSNTMMIRNKIRRLAESCLELKVSEKFRKINNWEFIDTTGAHYPCTLSKNASELANAISRTEYEPESHLGTFQGLVNRMVDVAIAEVTSKLKDDEDGSMNLPNITHDFSNKINIITMHGHFEALNGVFRDLRTLHRSADVVLKKSGNKFIASCGIGLGIADLHFPAYEIKYTYAAVSGNITASIDGINLDATVSIDYSTHPCMKKVDDLTVSEFGKVKVKITGLGLLNSLLSYLIKYITKIWKSEIVTLIEAKLTELIQQQLENFDCEKFRP